MDNTALRRIFFPQLSAEYLDPALEATWGGGYDNQTSGVQPPPATVPVTPDVDAAREGQVAAARARLQRRAEREAVSGVKPTYYDPRAHLRTRQLDQMGPRGPIRPLSAYTSPTRQQVPNDTSLVEQMQQYAAPIQNWWTNLR